MKSDIHIMLVSAQAAANLLPALDPALKPKRAVLVVTDKMRARAEQLADVLRQTGVAPSLVALENEHDFAAIEATLLTVATEHEGQSIALNVTGGTKFMALAAQSVASAAQWDVFYVDIDTDEVIWLGDKPVRHRLDQKLGLRNYLGGYGMSFVANPMPLATTEKQVDLLRNLLTRIGDFENALGSFNYLAQGAEHNGSLAASMDANQRDSRSLGELLSLFADAGHLKVSGADIRFTSKADLQFAKGGWLEHHVYEALTRMKGELHIRDHAANLALVTTDANKVKTELDAAFIANNRMYVIECKTARMDSAETTKANDTLFKLSDNCRRIGGIGTQGMLATYRPLREAEKRLAKALGITVVAGAELARLNEKLRNWVRPHPA